MSEAVDVGYGGQRVIPTNSCHTHQEVSMREPTKRLPMLPAERALKVISGRWKAIILYHLFGSPLRLSELQRLLPDVSQRMLIQQLREMDEHGILHREV